MCIRLLEFGLMNAEPGRPGTILQDNYGFHLDASCTMLYSNEPRLAPPIYPCEAAHMVADFTTIVTTPPGSTVRLSSLA